MPTSATPPDDHQSAPVSSTNLVPLTRGPVDIKSFLRAAVRITTALAELHAKDLIHKNIRPRTILIAPTTGEVRLAGTTETFVAHGATKGSADPMDAMPYTSPEQTEGMKRPVDHRADLYSLGIALYEHLTGTLPFHADDPLGWVQCHLTKPPKDPREVLPETPGAVAAILLKLMNKTVEERYQSARGLLLDLETCLVELEAKGRIEPFPLGARDVWHGLRISAKLYGREKESVELIAAFDRVLTSGTKEIALVSGYSGIGKSSLVQEMHKPIVRERGFFLSGKFDPHKRNIPYITISQAFRDVVLQILGETGTQLAAWKRSMIEALGPNGQLIIDVIPQVEQLIGPQPPVAPLPLNDAQNRFNNVFRQFIGLFAKKEHPLALFLDDLQYADFASLKLLQHLLADSDTRHFFVLGAFRDNEVSASHPFIMTLEEMRKAGVRDTSLVLSPLTVEHLTQLVADTFHCDAERAEPLARLLHAKTGGNPFFANQFLAELHHENLVRFDVDNAMWTWSTDEIEAKQFTDDVVELMADKLRRLPGETQAALQLAACIGNEFEVQMLEMTHDKTPEETYQDLDQAVRAEFMLRKGSIYKFLHDRVHQAAYSLIPEDQRSWVHLRIGRLLLERTPEADRDERSFDIVNQFNIGQVYISDPEERRVVAQLNLAAGRRAKASVAYQSATIYLSAGLALLSDESWDTDYRLTYDLHLELAECEYLNRNLEECERLCAVIEKRARSIPEKTASHRLRVQIYMTAADPVRAVQVGIEGAKLLGEEIPWTPPSEESEATAAKPTDDELGAEIAAIRKSMEGRNIEGLLDLPEATDPTLVALMNTIDIVATPAYYVSQNLYKYLMCRQVSLSIEHGNTGASAYGYAVFGSTLRDMFNENQDAFRYGKLAYDLTENLKYAACKPQVCNIFAGLISHWSRPVQMLLDYMKIGFRAGIECGNLTYSAFNRIQIIVGNLFAGIPLDEFYKDSEVGLSYIQSVKFMFVGDGVVAMQRLAQNMRGLTDNFSTFNGDGFNEEEFEAHLQTASIPLMQFWYHYCTAQARFMSGDYDKAMVAHEKGKGLRWTATGMLPIPEFIFYTALAAASHFGQVDEVKQGEYLEMLASHEGELRRWAHSSPENYAGKHLLVAAEIARIEGNREGAAQLYEQAIAAHKKSGFVHNEGVAHELAARFYLDGDAARAADHLRATRSCYAQWGALGKVQQLERLYPSVLSAS